MFLSYLCDQVMTPKMVPISFPPLSIPLSPPTLFLLLSLQQLIESPLPQNKEVKLHPTTHPQKTLQFYQLFILHILKQQQPAALHFLQSHYTELCSVVQYTHSSFSTVVIRCFPFAPHSSPFKTRFFSSSAKPPTRSPSTNSRSNSFPRSPSL